MSQFDENGYYIGGNNQNTTAYRQMTMTFDQYLRRTYLQMAAGLVVTAVIAFACYFSFASGGIVYKILTGFPYIMFVILIAQLGVAIALGASLTKLSARTIGILFYTYAALTGITFSTLPMAYGANNVFLAFAYSAVFFLCMAFIGAKTKADLSPLGRIMLPGLIAIIVVTVVNIFLRLPMIDAIICYIGLAIFIGLTAYDNQKLRQYYYHFDGDEAMLSKISTYSALQLYLDFINIFLYVLRILGRRNRH